MVRQKAEDQGCSSSRGLGGSFSIPCAYLYADPTVALSRLWWGLNGAAPIFSLSSFSTTAPNLSLYEWQSSTMAKELSAAVNWPGVLIGDPVSGQAGGFHVIGGKAFLFGTVRTDPPVQFPFSYVETRLYQIDLGIGLTGIQARQECDRIHDRRRAGIFTGTAWVGGFGCVAGEVPGSSR